MCYSPAVSAPFYASPSKVILDGREKIVTATKKSGCGSIVSFDTATSETVVLVGDETCSHSPAIVGDRQLFYFSEVGGRTELWVMELASKARRLLRSDSTMVQYLPSERGDFACSFQAPMDPGGMRSIVLFGPDGVQKRSTKPLGFNPYLVSFDEGGLIYAQFPLARNDTEIRVVSSGGETQVGICKGETLFELRVDPVNKRIMYGIRLAPDATGSIIRLDLDSGKSTVIYSGKSISDLCVDRRTHELLFVELEPWGKPAWVRGVIPGSATVTSYLDIGILF